MSSKSDFLNLDLPLNNEYQNTWDQPLNANFVLIDTFAKAVDDEISAARFTKASLSEFLGVAHNPDGTLLPSDEIIRARNSFTYGYRDLSGNPFLLNDRIYSSDREIFDAREGYPSLRASAAFRALSVNLVVTGAKDSNGYPTWLGSTGANAQIDGSVDTLWLQINGYLSRIRKLQQVAITGAAGTKYVYAMFSSSGVQTVDGDSTVAPPATPNGSTGSDGNDVCLFQDLTTDFTAQDVQPGDILTILGVSANAGPYQIKTVAPGGNVNQLKIHGYFPGGSMASLNYTITDPMAVTLGYDTSKTPTTGKFYLAEADFDGSSITATRAIGFKDYFVGEWRAIDVTTGGGNFEEIWNHHMFDDALDIVVQVSQANNGSQPVQQLSVQGSLTSTLGVTITDSITVNPGTFNPGTTNATYSPLPSKSGTVTGALTGSVVSDSAVNVKWDGSRIYVKNALTSVFYRDYTGTVRTSGYLRVIVSKKRM